MKLICACYANGKSLAIVWYVASSYFNLLHFTLAKDLVVVVAVDITTTGREVGIKSEVLVIETAAGKGDDE